MSIHPHDTTPISENEDLSLESMLRIWEQNTRPWQGYWAWQDKPVGERNAVREAFAGIGLEPIGLRSLPAGEDPPDCEVLVDGRLCGVEVTELVHESTMRRSLKALKIRKAGGSPQLHRAEAHFVWDQNSLINSIQARINRKDQPDRVSAARYDRYFLVIVTDEFYLDRNTVATFLRGAVFEASLITDVLFTLSYHPSPGGGGSCPVFPLRLKRR